jgi:hypothetical protein
MAEVADVIADDAAEPADEAAEPADEAAEVAESTASLVVEHADRVSAVAAARPAATSTERLMVIFLLDPSGDAAEAYLRPRERFDTGWLPDG